jgi:hypothetical protein
MIFFTWMLLIAVSPRNVPVLELVNVCSSGPVVPVL